MVGAVDNPLLVLSVELLACETDKDGLFMAAEDAAGKASSLIADQSLVVLL